MDNLMHGKLPIIGIRRLRMGIDGEGITTLIVTYGCPLQCKWCINPQTWQTVKYVHWVTAEELFEKVKMDWLYFIATGGGLTFGGGEPLLHIEFIKEFKARFGEDIIFNVETSLNVDKKLVQKSVGVFDTYIIDVKDWNEDIYKRYTGQNAGRMRENLNILLENVSSKSLVTKLPFIKGYNTVEDLDKSEDALRRLGICNIKRFEYIKQE